MNYKSFFAAAAITLVVTACNNGQTKEEPKPAKQDSTKMETELPATIDARIVDNMKDPACGMPVAAGINDTLRYDNKLYGFCSKECKEEFLKTPKYMIAKAELKK